VKRVDRHAAALVRVWKFPGESFGDSAEVGARAFERHAGLHSSDCLQRVRGAKSGPARKRPQCPHRAFANQSRFVGNDTHDREHLSVETDIAADDRRVAAKSRPPEPFPEDRDVRALLVV